MILIRYRIFYVLLSAFLMGAPFSGADSSASVAENALETLRKSNARLERFVLDNGMICLVKEDHSAPAVSVQIWIGTGSIHENEFLGSGLSHAVEHMAFKGTEKRSMGTMWNAITSAGGILNAYTTFDRTVYHTDIPSKSWKPALDVLADAVMNSTFPADEWEKEKEVILREFAMGKDSPDRVLGKLMWGTTYMVHPYKYPVIGIEEVFRRRTRDDLFKFYRHHYVPDNMITVIIGDVDAEEVKKALRETYAGFQRKARAPIILPQEPPQMSERFARKTGAYRVSRMEMAYHTVRMSHPDSPALDLLGYIVGHGRSSRLNKKIKEELKLVHSIGGGSYSTREPGIFVISATFDPEKEKEVLAEVRKEVLSWEESPVPPAELAKAKRAMLVAELSGLQTMKGQASSYATGEFYIGDPLFSETYLKALSKVTAKDIQAVIGKYFHPHNLTISVLSPEQDKPAESAADATMPGGDVRKLVLSNGIPLLVREDHRLPFLYFCATLKGGLLSENEKNNGITALMAELLTRGTRKRSSEQIAREVESLGASLHTISGQNSFGIEARCMSADSETFMNILGDCILNAEFPVEEVEKQRTVQLAAIEKQHEQPMFLAQKELGKMLFPGHPYSRQINGNTDSVKNIKRSDIQKHFRDLTVTGNIVFAVFGDVTPEQAKKLVEPCLEKIRKGNAPKLKQPRAKTSLPRIIMREEPKEQAIFLAGFPAIDVADPRMDSLNILTDAMSGLSSTLGVEVREKRGLVYFVGAVQRPGIDPGSLMIYAGTRKDAIEELEELVRLEIDRLVIDGLTEEEFERARNTIIARHEMGLQNNSSLAFSACLNEIYGLGYLHEFGTRKRLEKLTREQVLNVTQSILKTDNMGISIVVPETAISDE